MTVQKNIFEECDDIQSRFEVFHERNPHVYERFRRLALLAIRRGKTKIGAKQIIEVIRWEMWLQTESEDQYKINNDYTSRYARRFVSEFPEHKDKFEFRQLRS